MTDATRAAAWAALSSAGLAAPTLTALLRAFGEPERVLAASRASVEGVAGREAATRLASRDRTHDEATLSWLGEPGHRLLAWDDVDYPRELLRLTDPPLALYALGRVELLNAPTLAIVGSRHGTPQGLEDARAFARTLADAGFTIVSGLAQGIDAAAHRGAIDARASTIAVTGTGPDRVYPAANRDLAHAIATRGALVTEFAPGTPPLKGNFPRRNRLIAGLARGVLVVEAAPGSGSLITARLAVEQGKDVFAIPGSIHSPLSKGPHALIRDGAKLVETAQDVLVELGAAAPGTREARDARASEAPPADPVHASVLDAMGRGPVDLDRLVTRTGLRAEALAATLVHLQLEGRVAALPGGGWERLR
jgi:DNA processing protein